MSALQRPRIRLHGEAALLLKEEQPSFYLFLLFSTVFLSHLIRSLDTKYALGVDGYYYAGQVLFYNLEGTFKVPDSSPLLYFLVALSRLIPDIILANKIGAAILRALAVIGAFLMGRKIGGRPTGIGMALLVALSPTFLYLSVQLLKNLAAIVALLFFIWYLFLLRNRKYNRFQIIGFVIFFFLSLLLHRTTAVLAPLLIVLSLGGRFFGRRSGIGVRGRVGKGTPGGGEGGLKFTPFIPAVLLLSFILLLIGLLSVFGFLPGILHPADLHRFAGVFAAGPAIPALSTHFRAYLPVPLLVELTVAFLIPYVRLILFRPRLSDPLFPILVCALLLYHPFWNLDSLDMGFRIYMLGTPLSLMLLADTGNQLVRRYPFSRSGKVMLPLRWFALPPVLLLTLGSSGLSGSGSNEPPYDFYRNVIARFSLSADSLLICHSGLNLFYTFTTRKEALNYLPEYNPAPERLWRLSYFVAYERYERVIPEEIAKGRAIKILFPYHLLREDSWRKFMKNIPNEESTAYRNEMNPFRFRPRFLRPRANQSSVK